MTESDCPPRLPHTGPKSPGAAASPGDTRHDKGRHYCSAGCKQEQGQGKSRNRRRSRREAGPEAKLNETGDGLAWPLNG